MKTRTLTAMAIVAVLAACSRQDAASDSVALQADTVPAPATPNEVAVKPEPVLVEHGFLKLDRLVVKIEDRGEIGGLCVYNLH